MDVIGWVGRWVGGWMVDFRTTHSAPRINCLHPRTPTHIPYTPRTSMSLGTGVWGTSLKSLMELMVLRRRCVPVYITCVCVCGGGGGGRSAGRYCAAACFGDGEGKRANKGEQSKQARRSLFADSHKDRGINLRSLDKNNTNAASNPPSRCIFVCLCTTHPREHPPPLHCGKGRCTNDKVSGAGGTRACAHNTHVRRWCVVKWNRRERVGTKRMHRQAKRACSVGGCICT